MPMSTWIVRDGGPARGLRVAVKDVIDVAGLPTTAGCRAVARMAAPAVADASCLAGLRAAAGAGRASLAGKTNLHELAFGITGINPAFGTPVNPLDSALVPGGSSSGSAAAVGAGEADIAYGTDTGGSIRIPAACCGIAGLKTTWGRIPLDGVWPLAPSFDTVGPMARNIAGLVAGMELLEPGFQVLASPPARVGRIPLDADPVVDAAVDAALAAAGWQVVPVELAGLGASSTAALTLLEHEAARSNETLMRASPGEIGADVLARLRLAATIPADAIDAARRERDRCRSELARLWERFDLLALPTLAGFPPALKDASVMPAIRGATVLANLVGVPSLALPVPARAALPASIQLIGPAGSEDRLLAAGAVLELATRG